MKLRRFVVIFLAAISLAACSKPVVIPLPPTASSTPSALPAATLAPSPTPTHAAPGDTVEENEIGELVFNFGKRLQLVSLLSPTAAQDMQAQYAEFVSPALLDQWVKDVSTAPGRITSSPWPDRIEIAEIHRENADSYTVSGFVVEVTSQEALSGDAAARIPVELVVSREDGRWLISGYSAER